MTYRGAYYFEDEVLCYTKYLPEDNEEIIGFEPYKDDSEYVYDHLREMGYVKCSTKRECLETLGIYNNKRPKKL